MASRRTAKVSEAIRQVVSSAVLFQLKDPRVKGVTVLRAEVAGDLRTAKVYVSVLGDDKTERLCMQGLNSARGWLQSQIAEKLQLRVTPVLTFVADQGVKRSIEVSRLLREMHEQEHPGETEFEDDAVEDHFNEDSEE